jgi:voltage-gated potassium channel
LSTVGYGDVAPVSQPARGLACFEAICGQFYLAVLIAGLVGIRVTAPNRRGDSLQSDPGSKSPGGGA